MPKVAFQLSTARDLLVEDYARTLRQVAEIGYRAVEVTDVTLLKAGELRAALDEAGLQATSCHFPIELLERDLAGAIATCQTIGSPFVVIPWLSSPQRPKGDGWATFAETLNRWGRACHAAGLGLAYHHHDFEFEKVGGQFILDFLRERTDPAWVQWELDTYWIRYMAEDPAATIRRFAGRVPLLHLKDMAPGAHTFGVVRDWTTVFANEPASRCTFAEVGKGILDWPGIFAAAEAAGVQWYLVEQDFCARPPLESARLSLEHLRQWGVVS